VNRHTLVVLYLTEIHKIFLVIQALQLPDGHYYKIKVVIHDLRNYCLSRGAFRYYEIPYDNIASHFFSEIVITVIIKFTRIMGISFAKFKFFKKCLHY